MAYSNCSEYSLTLPFNSNTKFDIRFSPNNNTYLYTHVNAYIINFA